MAEVPFNLANPLANGVGGLPRALHRMEELLEQPWLGAMPGGHGAFSGQRHTDNVRFAKPASLT